MHQNSKKRILFISHDASRTGAPIVLLHFLKWIKKEGVYNFDIFLKTGGDLEPDFKQVTTTYTTNKISLKQRIFKRIISKTGIKINASILPSKLLKQKYDLVYLNTVACLDLARTIKKAFNCSVICHVHENDFIIKRYFSNYVNSENLLHIDRFIAVSESTRDNLITDYALKLDTIDLIYEYINLKEIKQPTVTVDIIRKELGLTNEFIIGGSGLISWRKGIDLFIQLAVQLKQLKPDAHFKLIWVGLMNYEFSCQFNYEAQRLGITNQFIFTGVKPVPQNYFQLFDVFALTSREDPFPLVAIEAASLNKPILCFNETGGVAELIKNGENGMVVPYGDVKAMAQVTAQLMDNKELLLKMGKLGGELMAGFDVNIAGKKIIKVIEKLLVS